MKPLRSSSIRIAFACIFAVITLAISSHSQASVTITYGGQFLRDNSNNALPDGALVMLVSAGIDGTFSFPSGLDFAPGDDVEFGRTVVDSSVSDPGSFLDSFSGIVYDNGDATADPGEIPGLLAGQQLVLRWFPTLTLTSTEPLIGTEYGEFRYVGTDALNPNPFETPSDGSAVDFLFLSDSGPMYDLTAGDVVPAPEPGSVLLVAIAGLATLVRRRR